MASIRSKKRRRVGIRTFTPAAKLSELIFFPVCRPWKSNNLPRLVAEAFWEVDKSFFSFPAVPRLGPSFHTVHSRKRVDCGNWERAVLRLAVKGAFFWAYSGIGIVGISQTIVRSLLSFQSGCKTFIVTLLTGSDMSVINLGPKRKDYLIIPAIPIPE